MLVTLRLLPPRASLALGICYARLLDRAVPRLRRVARENIALALPELPASERDRLIDGVFTSIGRLLGTFARFRSMTPANIGDWIRFEGIEHVDRAREQGRGVLFATGHLGNWELSALAFSLLARPMWIVVRPMDNPLLDRLAESYRSRGGNHSINKREFARAILSVLARNELVGILVDQHVSTGILVDFFGVRAGTSSGIAKIAARSGAAVVPGFALWSDAEHRYVLRFYPAVPITGDAACDTQRIQAVLESVIREYPDQWLWIHRRWKARELAVSD